MKKPLTSAYRKEYDAIVERIRSSGWRASMHTVAFCSHTWRKHCFGDMNIYQVALAEITFDLPDSEDPNLLMSAFCVFIESHLKDLAHVLDSVLSESFETVYADYCNYQKVLQASPTD